MFHLKRPDYARFLKVLYLSDVRVQLLYLTDRDTVLRAPAVFLTSEAQNQLGCVPRGLKPKPVSVWHFDLSSLCLLQHTGTIIFATLLHFGAESAPSCSVIFHSIQGMQEPSSSASELLLSRTLIGWPAATAYRLVTMIAHSA